MTFSRASKSGTIAINENDTRVVMVNPEAGTVSVFDTATNARIIELATGRDPSAVVFAPDNKTAYVANRGDATVVKIIGLDTNAPDVGPPLAAYDRVKVLLRIILVIPPYLIAYAMSIVATVGAVLAWFVILFTGKLPHGIYGIVRLGLSYQVRVVPYYLLLTETWPVFTQDGDADALRDPGSPAAIARAAPGPDAAAAFGVPAAQAPPELPGGFEPPSPPPGG